MFHAIGRCAGLVMRLSGPHHLHTVATAHQAVHDASERHGHAVHFGRKGFRDHGDTQRSWMSRK